MDDVSLRDLHMYRGQVLSAIRGKRGQDFLRELAVAMDGMPQKSLIRGELIDSRGQCCTIGVVCKSRGVDVRNIDVEEPEQVAQAVGIARQMAAEIEYENDEGSRAVTEETGEQRWRRMRQWVSLHLSGE